MRYQFHPFEEALLVFGEDVECCLGPECSIPWCDFWLNPRKVRGSDFLMRWSQGQWSESMLQSAVNRTGAFRAIPYGPSGVAPDSNVRDFELYFERLEHAGLGKLKRPDLLIVKAHRFQVVQDLVSSLGGASELPFIPESLPQMQLILDEAILAVECENSLWKSKQMPDYGTPLRPQKRLGGLHGLKKSAVVPTIILKEEDRAPLTEWQLTQRIPIHLWHSFYDQAFGIAFDRIESLIASGSVEPHNQTFQAPGGATTTKVIYKTLFHHGYPLAESTQEPELEAASLTDKNGHILPFVKFVGGRFDLRPEAHQVLQDARTR